MTTYARPAWIFRRLLGVVYVCAFSSMVVQLDGLFGSDGILPARDFMQAAREWTGADGLGLARFHVVPTLFWISTSDAFLSAVCIMGVGGGVLLAAGVAPLITTALPWIAYLSLMTVGQDFLGYQWDALLLETGFFALFVAPAGWLDRLRDAAPPMRGAVWLLLWLLFRLMVASGAVKLSSGDPTWANLTALTFHFETQPLPTPVAWYLHQAPGWLLKALCASIIAIELFAPLFVSSEKGRRRDLSTGKEELVSNMLHHELVHPDRGDIIKAHPERRHRALISHRAIVGHWRAVMPPPQIGRR